MLAGNIIVQGALFYIDDIIVSYVLDFLLGFATLFCLVFLLAGLVMSLSSKKGGSASFFEGLAGAKRYSKTLFLWSVVLALTGMLLFRILSDFPVCQVSSCSWLNIFNPFSYVPGILEQFPFNLTMDPNIFT